MATSFLEVYKANNLIKNDPRLKNLDGCELNHSFWLSKVCNFVFHVRLQERPF